MSQCQQLSSLTPPTSLEPTLRKLVWEVCGFSHLGVPLYASCFWRRNWVFPCIWNAPLLLADFSNRRSPFFPALSWYVILLWELSKAGLASSSGLFSRILARAPLDCITLLNSISSKIFYLGPFTSKVWWSFTRTASRNFWYNSLASLMFADLSVYLSLISSFLVRCDILG